MQSVVAGRLKVDNLLGMSEPEVGAAFSLIRYAESNGLPRCPKCRSSEFYDIPTRGKWKCKECYAQFSITSGTILGSRKMPLRNYLFALSLVLEPNQFRSILQFTQELNLAPKSAYDLINKIRACVTDANGCTVPFSLIDRAAWLIRRGHIKKQLSSLRFGLVADLNYPYLRDDIRQADGADLLTFVNDIVPKAIPDYIRADICQDMILAILSGQATKAEISNDARQFIGKVFADSPWKYKWMSMDMSLSGDEDGGTLHDMIADPNALAAFEEFEEIAA